MSPRLRIALLGALALCHCSSTQTCTLIGCSDQVTVKFAQPIAVPYSVTLKIDGKDATFICDAQHLPQVAGVTIGACGESSFLLIGAPASLTVTIPCGADGGAKSCTSTFSPTYQTVEPNGPTCAPSCKQSSVTTQ